MRSEIQAMTDFIIKNHDGQAYFNYEEASKIVGCGRHTLAHGLHNAGITIKKVGPSKRVSAYDLAYFMCADRISAVDNT